MCSHFFHSAIGQILGDVVGAVAGAFLGPEVFGVTAALGGAVGGGLAGAGASAVGGGKIGQDLLAGATGAIGGYGIGTGLSALGLAGTGAGAAGDVASAATGGLGTGLQTAADAEAALGLPSAASAPVAGLAPAAQATSAAADAAAPTAVSEAPVISGGPSAISAAPVTAGGTQADMASAIAANQGLAGGGVNYAAPFASDTSGTAGAAGAPAAADTATTGGGTSLGDTVSNAYHSLVGFPQSDLISPTTGQYTLPPPAPVSPGSTVVDPATGAAVSPGDAGYNAAVANLSQTPAVSPPAAAPQGMFDSIMSSPVTKLAGAAASGLGLLRSTSQASQANPIPGMAQVQQIAQQSATQGGILQSYLTTGTLPPAVQASVDQATQDGITAIKSKYASMGIAPNSTAEAQDIAHLKQNAVVQGATLADQLTQQGISLSTLSAQLYNDLVGYNQTLNTQTGQAISNLATALAGGGNTLTLNSNNQLTRAA